MAITGNIYTSYDFGFGTGQLNREDLLDIIVNIAPWDTPLFSTCPKTTTKHTTHEWIEDTLQNATAFAGGALEGRVFSADTINARSRKSNWTMIFRKDIAVTETQRALNPAGIKDEYAYQVSIGMKELARAMEYRLFAEKASATGDETTKRVMKVLDDFITTNTADSGGAADKATVDSLMEKCYSAGGVPDRIYCHPNTKGKFAASLGGANSVNYRNIAASDARVVGNIDVYISNFGAIQLVPDRFIPTAGTTAGYGRFWLIEQPKVRVAFLRPIKHVPLPPDGDRVRGMILGELTLEVMAEAAHGKAIKVTAG
jgi:hypothetical protein